MNKRMQERADAYYTAKEQIVATMMEIANRIHNPPPAERKMPEQIVAHDITKLKQAHMYATPSRGKEIFSFEYDSAWLKSPHALMLDPNLGLFSGPQYARDGHDNFGLFLDSSPDRWGRVLMQRREAQQAKAENRDIRTLMESDYMLGVYDGHRMGALRFRLSDDEPFLDNQADMAAPPWTKLRDLEYASLQLERDDAESDKDYSRAHAIWTAACFTCA